MKNYKLYIASLAIVLATAISCDKEVQSEQALKPLAPSTVDANAGTWKPILLTSNNQIPVAAPAATTSQAYLDELTAIKDLQANLNKKQRDAIEYWNAGGVLRWNEILRGMVARFNLPPAPNHYGTYPGPDAENPFGDPNFPFSNPPYAARAYSYVAAAQYDALKAAWYWKYQHNRPAPYTVDSGIEALMTKTDLPAYPSEDAVMSGVSAEVLKLMFPAAVEEITLKAAEQRNAALWSGKAAASDIAAGLALGKAVATIFIDRAKTDGMGGSVGNKKLWDLLPNNATSRGDTPWQSLETPPRPPMLPYFGLRSNGVSPSGVKMWMMTDADLIATRPVPPSPATSDEMAKEVAEVKWYSENLTRERLAIVHKWADGVSTSTPPGHWDEIASHYIEANNFSEVKAARAFALLNMALHNAGVSCWDTKFFYFNARPSQLDPRIKTGTGVPNFPSYTSGHSNFSAAASSVLGYLFPNDASYFEEQAKEAALSRLYGAIHYRSDCEIGLTQGKDVAAFTINFAKTDGAN